MAFISTNYGFERGNSRVDNLMVGEYKTREIVIAANQTIKRGTVVGEVTASGHFIKSVQTATDGSQNAITVCLDEVTTGTNEEAKMVAVEWGKVAIGELDIDSSYDDDTKLRALYNSLRDKSVYPTENMKVENV